MESIHLEVRGRVQGVGFRWYVVDKARELHLAGWVKNRGDGNVELAAAGEPDALAKLEAAVTSGPPGARVEGVRRLGGIAIDSLESPFGIAR
jgi:acylphosphatase